jgi:hypothetical protein
VIKPGFRILMFCAMIAACADASAEGFDLARLMSLLSAGPDVEAPYTEKKYSSLLTEPLASSGLLVYHRPDAVEKNVLTPRKERFRFAGDELIVTRNGTEKHYPLESQPLLSAFAAGLRGVLSGDLALLKKHYQLALEGEEGSWRLELLPLDHDISRYVERILINGRAGHVQQIEIREANGDRSVLQVH